MTAEYELTKDDLSAFNLYHHAHSPTSRRQYLMAWLLPGFLWLLACIGIWFLADRERGQPLQTFLDLLPLFCGLPIWFCSFPWWYRRKLRKVVNAMVSEGQNRQLFSRHTVTLAPDGITESGEFGLTSTNWSAVERVVRAEAHVFVYTGALSAVIVPGRAFAGVAEFEEFARTASGYHEKAVTKLVT